MQGWIQMIMTNFNEEAGDLNFLPSCHNCSMIVHKPGSQVLTYCFDIFEFDIFNVIFSIMRVMRGNQ